MRVLESLVIRWRSEGLALLAPETAADVCAAFTSAGSRATSDVVSLYAALGGMEQMDDDYWRLWPLQEVKSENVECSRHGVLFSDYLMNCWCYRLRPNADDTSSVLVDYFDGEGAVVVAETLEQFFAAYAVNATALLDARSLAQVRDGDA